MDSRSTDYYDLLDFERDIPTTPGDIAAREAARKMPRMSLAEYLERLSLAGSTFCAGDCHEAAQQAVCARLATEDPAESGSRPA